MPAQLVALNDGPSILLDKPILLLGRHPECDVQIDSRKVSRRHCCIAQVNDYLVVRDLDSTNGIRINGVRVTEGRLDPGDELTIGSHRYEVSWDSDAAPAIQAPHAGKPAHKPMKPPLHDVADDLLESCDEPVALAEPERLARPVKAPPPPAPPAALPLREQQDEGSVILPDNLELMPGSGPFPPLRQPPPGPPVRG